MQPVGDVFQMGGPLFDSTAHTQAGLPHLIQYLWDQYSLSLQTTLEERATAGKQTVTLEEAKKKAPATHFADFATRYLEENRVSQSFFIDANHGLLFDNGVTVAVCPGINVQGTMQDSGSVAVTEGKDRQQGPAGVARGNSSFRV